MLMPCQDVLCLLRCPTLGQDLWRNMGQSPRGAALLGSTQPWDHFRSTRAEPSPVCTNLLPSPIAPESKAELSDGSDSCGRHMDAVEMSQTKLQLQGQGGHPWNRFLPAENQRRSDLRLPPRWTRGARAQRGKSFSAGSLAIASLAVSSPGSFL